MQGAHAVGRQQAAAVLPGLAAVGSAQARQEDVAAACIAPLAAQLHGTGTGLLAVLHKETAGRLDLDSFCLNSWELGLWWW